MSQAFDRIKEIMATLRAPGGCPWDRKQTHESLKPYLLEETYEVLETIDQGDIRKLKEELGDVLLQVLFHSQIAAESGAFTVDEVMNQLAEKLVRRHPHVFQRPPDREPNINSEQVLHRWEEIKRAEREESGQTGSVLQDVPKTLPALLRAYQVQARAARVGFDWPDNTQGLEQVGAKIDEELAELRQAIRDAAEEVGSPDQKPAPPAREVLEAELGDVLFSLVNFARHLKLNPEDALRRATNRFTERFRFIEDEAAKTGRTVSELSLSEMDRYWDGAKKLERSAGDAKR
ncbi:MAG TPA: nucleoside triphosphate pyrophosphohydrolase [Nitrospiraceae bacterium]|nr:nucleoside triphosphate pyrophosphohydrolase [Nitrospiraceae bacterium]